MGLRRAVHDRGNDALFELAKVPILSAGAPTWRCSTRGYASADDTIALATAGARNLEVRLSDGRRGAGTVFVDPRGPAAHPHPLLVARLEAAAVEPPQAESASATPRGNSASTRLRDAPLERQLGLGPELTLVR